jgi:hypothetical protein
MDYYFKLLLSNMTCVVIIIIIFAAISSFKPRPSSQDFINLNYVQNSLHI